MRFRLIQDATRERSSLTVFFENGNVQMIDDQHPNWRVVVDQILGDGFDEDEIETLMNPLIDFSASMEQLTERVSIAGNAVLFDGEPVESPLSNQIARLYREGNTDWEPLVNFWTKVSDNPNPHSREHLMRWLSAEDFSITPDGDIVGYKGVVRNSSGGYRSLTGGRAKVNGQPQNGQICQNLGDVVSMPREQVTFNPSEGCSYGLHVGTYSYASTFGPVTLEVHVDPADVVSVPTDCNWQKMRTCAYKVVREISSKKVSALVGAGDNEDDEDYESEEDYEYDDLDF